MFIGGSPIYAEVETSETTNSTTYVALATAGPSISVPVAGDYVVENGFVLSSNTSTGHSFMSYDIGGTGAVDADACETSVGTGGGTPDNVGTGYRKRKKSALTAITLTSKYKVNANTNGFKKRWMALTPIAIGG